VDHATLVRLLAEQDGVVCRRQVLGAGGNDSDIETAMRRRRWARLHDGVYVDHTGVPSWRQRAWGAVLLHWPSALAGESALVAHGLTTSRRDAPIELVVPTGRRVDDPPGVRTRRLTAYDDVVLHQLSPPRVRVEHAVLTVASGASSEDGAVAVVADACQQRRTTPRRLVDALATMTRLPRRALLSEVLADVATGAYSALERRYLRDVERAHGLPTGRRQRRELVVGAATVVFRDVAYEEQDTLVELDGRLGHEAARDRWADLSRDLAAAVSGRLTLRAGWGQALQPCRLALAVAAVLRARGWQGEPLPCGPACPLRDSGGSPAPEAGDPPMSAA
jgi:hypothetical protein